MSTVLWGPKTLCFLLVTAALLQGTGGVLCAREGAARESAAQESAAQEPSEREGAAVKFNEAFRINLSANYNFLNYSNASDNDKLRSNRPLDAGIGFGYKNFTLGFSINIPFLYNARYQKSTSFDFAAHYYFQESIYFDGYIKYYDGFHSRAENETADETKSKIFLSGISGEYVFNKSHSIRSVYNLDRKQTVSNGSFLAGGGVFFSAANVYNDSIQYSEKRMTFHAGPNAGYSYTLVMKNNFFANIILVLGINGTVSGGEFNFNFQSLPKISFGCHGKTWSANICFNYNALIYLDSYQNEYNVYSGTAGLNFSKRF